MSNAFERSKKTAPGSGKSIGFDTRDWSRGRYLITRKSTVIGDRRFGSLHSGGSELFYSLLITQAIIDVGGRPTF